MLMKIAISKKVRKNNLSKYKHFLKINHKINNKIKKLKRKTSIKIIWIINNKIKKILKFKNNPLKKTIKKNYKIFKTWIYKLNQN